ncbi:MAG TPA: aspartyl protease family protein [Blastocatellia bacterium]|nr:aspartyl protease family protein [Blastocatellia bacterium]
MKSALRMLTCILAAMTIVVVLSFPTRAESRGKALKRAEKEMRAANFAEAEKVYRQLIEKDLTDKDARLGLSFALIKQIKLQEAYEHAAQVIAADPLNARAFALLGTSLLRSGEFRNSVEALYTAVKFDQKQALAIAGLSEIEYFENRSKTAYDGLRKAISLEPNEPDYYVSLARACSRLEFYTEAADAYQRFLEVSPKTDAERRARIKGLIDFYRYLGTTKINRVSGKDISTISFELVNNRPFIRLMVNGKGPFRFVVDTGASMSVLSDKTAAVLGVKPVAKGGSARAIGGSGTFPILYGLLDSIQIGEARIETVPIYIRTVHSTEDTPEGERSDGYIGLSVLSQYAVTLDYKSQQLMLDRTPLVREDPLAAKPDTPNAGEPAAPKAQTLGALAAGVEVPIRSTSGGLASAEAHLPTMDRPLNFIVDTGATISVISKASVKRFELEGMKLKGETFRVIGAAGVEDGAEALGLATLTVNNLRKNNARALILDLDAVNETSGFEQHGVLGGDYLRHFRVMLDLRRNYFGLTPQSPAIEVAAEKK